MDFLLGERLAVDLLNTVILQDGRVRDLLGGAGDVAAWAEAAGVLPRGVVRVTSLGSEPAGLRAFREALRRGLVASAGGARPAGVLLLLKRHFARDPEGTEGTATGRKDATRRRSTEIGRAHV